MSNKILIVEDDSTLSMIISETLQHEGFDTITAANGEEGLQRFSRHNPDIIIADVMMPRMDGFEMARKIRQSNRSIPILFLTAKSEIENIVEGFELGGNDYLKKPFKMLELIVRIKALLHLNQPKNQSIFEVGEYQLDITAQTLRWKREVVAELTIIETRLLKELIMNIGHTVDASLLMILVWQRDDPYSRNSLHGFIHKLRHYLRHDSAIVLINQRGIGYMLTKRKNPNVVTE